MASKKPENMSFEESLTELDTLVNQLENGDLDLEDALKKFERGIALARSSQTKLCNCALWQSWPRTIERSLENLEEPNVAKGFYLDKKCWSFLSELVTYQISSHDRQRGDSNTCVAIQRARSIDRIPVYNVVWYQRILTDFRE